MRIRSAASALVLAVLPFTACTSSSTSDPATSETPLTAFEPSSTVELEVVETYDGSAIPGLKVPVSMAFDRQGQLHVVNAGRGEILVLNSDGKVQRRWGKHGTGPGEFNFLRDPDPRSALGGMAFAADGSVFVVESGAKRVQHLTAEGRPLAEWGRKGRRNGQFLEPIGIAVAPSGDVFVVDDMRDDIQVFSPEGRYLRTIGSQGQQPGQLSDTGNIRIDGDGNLVNADYGSGRVQAWDEQGTLLWTLPEPGARRAHFHHPLDVAFGRDGSLFVIDDTRVQIFDSARRLIGVWPTRPSNEYFGGLALNGDELWIEVLFPYKLLKLKVAWVS